jgi:hypothetical protein
MQITRRGLITGLAAFVAAPAIVRATSLMPVKPVASIGEFKLVPGDVTRDYLTDDLAFDIDLRPGGINIWNGRLFFLQSDKLYVSDPGVIAIPD